MITGTLLANGCERPSYPSIVGSGMNSTVLHYMADDANMQSGGVVVMDAAGEYSMYASDVTRTVPVNGHFTDRQREIYNIVLGAQRATAKAFVSGRSSSTIGNTLKIRSMGWPATTSRPTEKTCMASRSTHTSARG